MFIELALEDLAPTTLMAARVAIAAVALAALLAATRGVARAFADVRRAGRAGLALGVINNAIPFTLIAWGQEHIDSGTAAIANASTPIWVALLAIWYRESERASGARGFGIVLGLVGVAILAGAQPEASWWALAGTMAVVAASLAYAIGSLMAQGRMAGVEPLALSTTTTLGATLTLLPFGLLQLPAELPGAKATGSVLALGLLGTAVGMVLFFRVINDYGSARASLVTYLLPVTALVYGAALLSEPLTLAKLGGLVLILLGVALGSGVLRVPRGREAIEPAAP